VLVGLILMMVGIVPHRAPEMPDKWRRLVEHEAHRTSAG